MPEIDNGQVVKKIKKFIIFFYFTYLSKFVFNGEYILMENSDDCRRRDVRELSNTYPVKLTLGIDWSTGHGR